jgi:hypothetical protein
MKSKKQVLKYGLLSVVTICIITTISYSYALSGLKTDNESKNTEKEATESIILEFLEGCCDPESVDPWNQSQLGIKETTWLDNSTVFIQAYVSINCGHWIEGGGFHIHNNTITLTYFVGRSYYIEGNNSELRAYIMADCICDASLSFTLSNLDSNKYNFELEPRFVDHLMD